MKLRIVPNPALWLALCGAALVAIACTDDTGTASIPGAVGGATGADRGGSSTANTGTTTTQSSATGGTGNSSSTSAVGGTQPSSSDTSSSSGGTAASTGGTSSATSSATGGRSSSSSATGGRVATGGASSTAAGGTSTAAGGSANSSTSSSATGGRATGGATAGVGGNTRGSSSGAGRSSVGGQSTGGGGNNATGGASPSSSTSAKFSFFVTSYAVIKVISGSDQGFGGDLRHGETGDGAGLRGADKLCTEIAERSMAGNGKTWKAYLSTSTVSAIDRIGEGPWYDRRGRTIALNKAALLFTRPQGADAAIINDLPNEDGVPNHSPDGSQVDNHDTLTGSNHTGTLFSANAHCSDWTSSAKDTTKPPRVGHTWPRGSTGTGNTPGMAHWASALDESGCGAGVNLVETGGPGRDGTVGSGGGYGGFYCFALTP